jgi:hypothetical protein
VNPHFGDSLAYRLDIPKKAALKTFDASNYYATHCGVCQSVEPGGELRKGLHPEHTSTVIERLHTVKIDEREQIVPEHAAGS